MEMAADMMKAGTIADSVRATQIEEQVMQDWKNRHKQSKKWGKIMQGRSRVRTRALKREPYNKPAVWVGSKVTKPGAPIQKKAPLHMLAGKLDVVAGKRRPSRARLCRQRCEGKGASGESTVGQCTLHSDRIARSAEKMLPTLYHKGSTMYRRVALRLFSSRE
jgi:hypothetical protein